MFWTGGAVHRRPDGVLVIPVTITWKGRRLLNRSVTLSLDEASALHAQLDRLLCTGWARTDGEQASRTRGESRP